MNLLIYTENHVFGGGNKYMIDFINALNHNYNVTLITNKNGLTKNELTQIKHKITHSELNILSYNYMFKNLFILNIIFKLYIKVFDFGKELIINYISNKNRQEFEKIMLIQNYDYVFAFNGGLPGATSCLDLLNVTGKYNIKSVLSIVSMPIDRSVFTKYYYNTIKNINYFIVNCSAIKKSLIINHNIHTNKIYVISQYIDLPMGYKTKLLDNNKIKLGFVGRIEKGKGIFILLKAFKELNKINKNISLEIYGKSYLKLWEKFFIHFTYSNKNIHFNGTFQSINQVYNSIDLLVLPSFWEGLPYVILESMSFGVPVIASDIGGISEVVVPYFNGYLIKKNSHKSLFDILDNFDISSYTFYSNNSRFIINENFTKNIFESKITSFFSESNQKSR
jgi:glycosyltransferase involved in cell wall biosynthesis